MSFKVVLLGEGRVGKTSILLRFAKGEFSDKQLPTSPQTAYIEKTVFIGSAQVNLKIWETAGQEQFRSLGPIYYREAKGAIIVYDITDTLSFERVQKWVKELKVVDKDICIIIVGNKVNLEKNRAVSIETATM